MGVSKNNGKTPNHPMFNRVFHYFHHPWCKIHPIFASTPIFVTVTSFLRGSGPEDYDTHLAEPRWSRFRFKVARPGVSYRQAGCLE